MEQNVKLLLNTAQSRLTNKLLSVALAAFTGVICLASAQPALAQSDDAKRFETPTVFQAAGPSAASIQSTVDQFRAALGTVNNAKKPGQVSGRREINWDGGSPTNAATTLSGTPLTAFLNTRALTSPHAEADLSKPHRRAWPTRLGTRATPRSSTRSARCGSSRRSGVTSPKSNSLFQAVMEARQRLPPDSAWFLPTSTPQMGAPERQDGKPSRQHFDRVLRHPRPVAFH